WVQCGFKFLVGGFDVEHFGGVSEPSQFDSLDIHFAVERQIDRAWCQSVHAGEVSSVFLPDRCPKRIGLDRDRVRQCGCTLPSGFNQTAKSEQAKAERYKTKPRCTGSPSPSIIKHTHKASAPMSLSVIRGQDFLQLRKKVFRVLRQSSTEKLCSLQLRHDRYSCLRFCVEGFDVHVEIYLPVATGCGDCPFVLVFVRNEIALPLGGLLNGLENLVVGVLVDLRELFVLVGCGGS